MSLRLIQKVMQINQGGCPLLTIYKEVDMRKLMLVLCSFMVIIWVFSSRTAKIQAQVASVEICNDNIDNDGDNKIDCDDPDCHKDPFCAGASALNCHHNEELVNINTGDCSGIPVN